MEEPPDITVDEIGRFSLEQAGIDWEEFKAKRLREKKEEEVMLEGVMRRELSVAVGLALQGIELILKGRIASVSPYLLIASNVREWPSSSVDEDISFSNLKTVGAQELPKLHDAVFTQKLADEFKPRYEELRKLRNKIVHSVAIDIKLECKQVLMYILDLLKGLDSQANWMEIRKSYREVLLNDEVVLANHCHEMGKIIDLFSSMECKHYFLIEKNASRYLCPECKWGSYKHMRDMVPELAHLVTEDVSCDHIFCPVCVHVHEVKRDSCPECEDENSVFEIEGSCLKCGYG